MADTQEENNPSEWAQNNSEEDDLMWGGFGEGDETNNTSDETTAMESDGTTTKSGMDNAETNDETKEELETEEGSSPSATMNSTEPDVTAPAPNVENTAAATMSWESQNDDGDVEVTNTKEETEEATDNSMVADIKGNDIDTGNTFELEAKSDSRTNGGLGTYVDPFVSDSPVAETPDVGGQGQLEATFDNLPDTQQQLDPSGANRVENIPLEGKDDFNDGQEQNNPQNSEETQVSTIFEAENAGFSKENNEELPVVSDSVVDEESPVDPGNARNTNLSEEKREELDTTVSITKDTDALVDPENSSMESNTKLLSYDETVPKKNEDELAYDRERAAIIIQANTRGRLQRTEEVRKQNHEAASRIQAHQRGKAARQEIIDRREAALKIQSSYRGRLTRKQLQEVNSNLDPNRHGFTDIQKTRTQVSLSSLHNFRNLKVLINILYSAVQRTAYNSL